MARKRPLHLLLALTLALTSAAPPPVSHQFTPHPEGFQPNDTILRIPLDRVRDILLPTLAPSDRFILRIAPAVPTPKPSPSATASPAPGGTDASSSSSSAPSPPPPAPPRPDTTLVIDLVSPRQHRLVLTAVSESTPFPCPLHLPSTSLPSDLPPYCAAPHTDTTAYLTRSSRAFVRVSALPADTAVVVSVTNSDVFSLSALKLQFARVQYALDAPICPGSALQERCSNIGTCDTDTASNISVCNCPPDFGDRACHVPVRALDAPQTSPTWKGMVRPLENSTLVSVSLNGTVNRIRPPGAPSKVAVRARVLVGAVEYNSVSISVDGGDALLSMLCKSRGEDKGSSNNANNGGLTLDEGTDVPTIYDTDARAQVIRHPVAGGGGIFDLLCVSDRDVGSGHDWLVAFIATTLVANTSAARVSLVSVRVTRCGARDLPECPLGVRSGTVSLAAWVGIGIGCVLGIVLLVACVFFVCHTTIKGLPESHRSGGGILDGRFYQVVDYGGSGGAATTSGKSKSKSTTMGSRSSRRSHSSYSHPYHHHNGSVQPYPPPPMPPPHVHSHSHYPPPSAAPPPPQPHHAHKSQKQHHHKQHHHTPAPRPQKREKRRSRNRTLLRGSGGDREGREPPDDAQQHHEPDRDGNGDGEEEQQEERVYPRVVIRRTSPDAPQQHSLVDWDAVRQAERERRSVQYEEDAYRNRTRQGGGGDGDDDDNPNSMADRPWFGQNHVEAD